MKETRIIEQFYEAFEKLDAERMVALYHPEVTFKDPVFGILKREHAKNMWRMLCESQKGKDFKVTSSAIDYQENSGTARWDAYYTFGATGRKVHNKIQAHFSFQEGKIINHVDSFDLYRWSKQAMGFKGFLMGWTPFFKNKINAAVTKQLSKFEAIKKA
jgi:limonene-1,2-epoxide hydrolase